MNLLLQFHLLSEQTIFWVVLRPIRLCWNWSSILDIVHFHIEILNIHLLDAFGWVVFVSLNGIVMKASRFFTLWSVANQFWSYFKRI
jgi:hypothetical protein